jgi:prepilin-type N-terminal cleavage/methylation domain-containing protein
MHRPAGFSMIELLVVVGIIGVLVTLAVVAAGGALRRSRDAKRLQALSLIGRYFSGAACPMPDGGPGDYDLSEISGLFPSRPGFQLPEDPGNHGGENGYRYVVSEDGALCALYANLEVEGKVTLQTADAPGAVRGNGVLEGEADGNNGTRFYYQVTN